MAGRLRAWGEFLKKNRYVLLVLLLGLMLLCWPQENKQPQNPDKQQEQSPEEDLEKRLEAVLGQVSGVGTVRVLLTKSSSETTLYQTDEAEAREEHGGNVRRETVLVTDGSRQQTGLVQKIQAPSYRGALVVCQGGDVPAVRLAVVEAVAGVTGLSTNRITVLKMK